MVIRLLDWHTLPKTVIEKIGKPNQVYTLFVGFIINRVSWPSGRASNSSSSGTRTHVAHQGVGSNPGHDT